MDPRFKRCPKLSSHSSRNCLLCLRCSSPLCGPSLNFDLEILSAVTSCICAIVRTWIYVDRILSDEADSTIYGREFHAAELGRSLSHIRGDSLHLTDLEKWPNHALQRTAPRVTLVAAGHPAACAHPDPHRLRPQPERAALRNR
jgi:hypothetical protein